MTTLIHLLQRQSNLILIISIVFCLISVIRQNQVSYYSDNAITIASHSQNLLSSWSSKKYHDGDSSSSSSENQIIPKQSNLSSASSLSSLSQRKICRVYTGLYSPNSDRDKETKFLSKRLETLLYSSNSYHSSTYNESTMVFEYYPMDIPDQLEFLKQYGKRCYQSESHDDEEIEVVLHLFQQLILTEHTKPIAQELWKFCALNLKHLHASKLQKRDEHSEEDDIVAYIDIDTPFLNQFDFTLAHGHREANENENYNIFEKNVAVLGHSLSPVASTNITIHGSLLIIQKEQIHCKSFVNDIIRIILSNVDTIIHDPLYLPQRIYSLIYSSQHMFSDEWILLQQRCHSNPFQTIVDRRQQRQKRIVEDLQSPSWMQSTITCPRNQTYCCDIIQPSGKAIMVTRHILLPYLLIPNNESHGLTLTKSNQEDIPFITLVVQSKSITSKTVHQPKNFFQYVSEQNCQPTSHRCELCMSRSEFNAGTCKGCAKYCSCFCDLLCHVNVEEKVVSNIYTAVMPKYKRDPTRLIPRIIHQTWFEPVTREAYPNFSRLTESWKQQLGWEYRFWDDDDAVTFLATYFPPEVKDAYDTLLPGAFKADLFRYCVLFIYGGVYADIDVMLTSKLEVAIDDDVGFMVPLDSKPGKESGHTMCLWNGLLISQPGHPILAKVIETVVNNIRNRFTSLDVMNTLCPDVHFSVGHKYNILFTSGPCILGATVNKMLNRHPQTSFEIGEVKLDLSTERFSEEIGRFVILEGNKNDMGAFRFTYTDKNLIIATTDMPNFDDRPTDAKDVPENHYSKVKKKGHVYGLKGLYKDNRIAHENIKIDLA